MGEELEYLDMLGIEFPKDRNGGNTIRDNWVTNMEHFGKYFKPLKGDYSTEELLILKVDDDHYLQGYADLIKHNDDGSVSVLDWKSSSMYSDEDFEHAAYQLVIYGLAKEAEGFEVKSLSWIFMKYVTMMFMGKKRSNSKTKEPIKKHIERRKIGKEMSRYVKDDLKEAGYGSVEIDLYIDNLIKTNSFAGLPDEIRTNYKMAPCVISTPFDDEAKEKTWQFINDTIEDFEVRGFKEEAWPHREFTTVNRAGKAKEDTFYCNALCSYGNTCKHIAAFNESKLGSQDDDYSELF